MSRKKTKICISCHQSFRGRSDARTCSERCRKRAQRVKALLAHEAELVKDSAERVLEGFEHELRPAFATEGGFVGDAPAIATAGNPPQIFGSTPNLVKPQNTPVNPLPSEAVEIGQPNPYSTEPVSLAAEPAPVPVVSPVEPTPAANLLDLSLEEPAAQSEALAQRGKISKSLKRAGVIAFSAAVLTVISYALLTSNHNRQASYANQAGNVPPQGVVVEGETPIETSPVQLQSSTDTLIVNGDLAARGSVRLYGQKYYGGLQEGNLTADQTYTLPNSTGTICLDSNNCAFATGAQLAQFQNQVNIQGGGVTSINGRTGNVTISGTANQVITGLAGNAITLSLPQDIAAGSTPHFASINLTNVGIQNGNQICDTSGNCAGIGGMGDILNNGNTFGSAVTLGTNDNYGLNLETNNTTVASFTNNGAALFKNASNSTTAFQVQNSTGGQLFNVDTSSSNITLGGLNSAELQAWATNTNVLPVALTGHSSVIANGYVYVIGGDSNGSFYRSSVYYAKLNTDGSTGAWATNSNSLPAGRSYHTSVVANGYVYVIGGYNYNAQDTVYYAKLNTDGSTGAWYNANSIPDHGRYYHTSVVANGYIYIIGGMNKSTVYYAKLNADGSIGNWQTNANPLPDARGMQSSVIANGYVYVIGGLGSGYTAQSTVYYAKLNVDGSIGTWSISANSLPDAREMQSSVIANGYVYVIAGYDGSGTLQSTVYYAKLNADGSTGAWGSNVNPLLSELYGHSSVVTNGYVYAIGGSDSSSIAQSSVFYASTARILLGGSLDLVGLGGQNLSDPGDFSQGSTGGSLTAGNTSIIGALNVQGQAAFAQGMSIGQELRVSGSALFQNVEDSTTAFQVQDASGTPIFWVDTSNSEVGIGAPGLSSAYLYNYDDETLGVGLNLYVGGTLSASGPVTFQNTADSTTAFQIQDSIGTNLILVDTTAGTVTIVGLQGSGAGLTNLNASNISSGTLDNARLSANVTLQGNTFNGANQLVQLNPSGDLPVLSGLNLTNLNATNISAGTLNDGRLSTNVTVQGNTFNGASQLLQLTGLDYYPALNGSLITNLNASNVASGTLSDSYLSNNVALLNAVGQVFSGTDSFSNTVTAPGLQSAGATLAVGTSSSTLQLQGDISSTFAITNSGHTVSLGFSGTPSGNVTYNLDNAATPGTYTICTSIGNCGSSGDEVTTLGGTTNKIAKFTGGQSIGDSSISDNGTTVTVQPLANSTNSFQIQNAAGNSNLLIADTTDTRIAIGQAGATYTLDVAGDINSTTGLRVAGNLVCDSSGCIAASSSGFYIQNSTSQQNSANFNIQSANAANVGGVISGAVGQSADLLQLKDSGGTAVAAFSAGGNLNITGQYQVGGAQISSANLSNNANLAKLDGTGPQIFTGNNEFTGTVLLQNAANSATAFQIQNAAGTSNLLIADTTNTRIGIGVAPGYTLDVAGDMNISSGSYYRINGVAICGPTASCAPSAGSGNYVQNTVALQTGANFNIQSVNSASVVGIVRGAAGQSADLFRAQDENGANVFTVGSVGSTTITPSTNSISAFKVQNASSDQVFAIDTSGNQAVLGKASTLTGKILFYGSGGTGTLTLTGPTTPNAGNYTLTIPAITGNANICTDNSVCSGYAPSTGGGGYIQLQGSTPGSAQTGNFNISGTGIAGTLQASYVDTAAAGALAIGNTNAASVDICNSAACDTVSIGTNTDADAINIGDANDTVALLGTTTVNTSGTDGTSMGNATGTLTLAGNSSSTIVLNGSTISAAELNLLDGHDVALVDTNDAVSTAIIGTGALASGSIADGFGTIATSNTITGTTLNSTTGINTGATAGTQRIDSSGNHVNAGNYTGIGAVTIQPAAASALTLTGHAASTWSTDSGNLTIDSGGGTLIMGANTTTLQKAATAFTVDLNNASDSTLTVTNAGAGVASLSVEGDVSIGSGRVYKINGTQITSAALSNDSNLAKLDGTGPQTFTGNNKFTGTFLAQNAADSTTAFQIQNVAGNNYLLVNTSGASVSLGNTSIASTIQIGNTTGAVAQTINIGNNSTGSSASTVAIGSIIGTSPTTIQGGSSGITLTSAATTLVKPSADSATAFQIQKSDATVLLVADTSSLKITLGAAGSTPILLVLGTKNTTGDPACTEGSVYYNSSDKLFRGCQNATWYNLVNAVDIQTFTASGTWTKPVGVSVVTVDMFGGGGGGGGGYTGGACAAACTGGGGGGGGQHIRRVYPASLLSSPVSVTVGTQVSGGGASSGGTAGIASSFGSYATASGGSAGGAGGTGDGNGGTGGGSGVSEAGGARGVTTAGSAGEWGGGGGGGSPSSGAAGTTGGDSLLGGGAGGGGGSTKPNPTKFNGGAGGGTNQWGSGHGGAGGTANGTAAAAAGSAGTDGNIIKAGTGGGGGAPDSGDNGRVGGAGGIPSGGGGGGGGGFSGGTGGTGARGEVWVYSW